MLDPKTNRQWSLESHCADHRDVQASLMDLSPNGSFVLLGGKKCLALIDVEAPDSAVTKIHRPMKHDPCCLKWSADGAAVALAWGDQVDLYNIETLEKPVTSFVGSNALVVDVDWNKQAKHFMVSASVSKSLYIWDLRLLHSKRQRNKPVLFNDSSSYPNHVKWNKVDENLIASAHDSSVKMWDIRQFKAPIHYISAHQSRINCLEMHPIFKDQFITCGQDCQVKMHLVNNDVPVKSLHTAVPIWKARYTPFGDGISTVVVPQLKQNVQTLFLWQISDLNTPKHSFFGHKDIILDFGWIEMGDVWRLVTWSKGKEGNTFLGHFT